MDESSPNERSIISETRSGDGVLNSLLEFMDEGSKDELGENFACVGVTLAILRGGCCIGGGPHLLGQSLESVNVDCFEVLEEINASRRPLVELSTSSSSELSIDSLVA